jgi:hypothetical protein
MENGIKFPNSSFLKVGKNISGSLKSVDSIGSTISTLQFLMIPGHSMKTLP